MLLRYLPEPLKDKLRRVPFLLFGYRLFIQTLKKLLRQDYSKWIKDCEPSQWQPLVAESGLTFSVVVPVFNTSPKMLSDCVQSVLQQSYQDWELILVDDASDKKETLNTLTEIEVLDARIKVIRHSVNQHISLASNTGIAAAQGAFIGVLDHDDMLSPHALNEMAFAIVKHPNAKWLYSDEDFLSGRNKRFNPHFKTDWNLYLLRSHNYITHFCLYEAGLLKQLGGFRKGFEGAQDYDLALRASELVRANDIIHIPKVLYHWRVHKESSSSGNNAKPYTVEVGRKALQEHLERSKVDANVENTSNHNFYKVDYLLKEWPQVSIVIPTRDQHDVLKACVDSILSATSYPNYEIVIMDNQTECPQAKAYLAQLSEQSKVKVVLFDEVFNYSKINNDAISHCGGEYLVLLNNDTKVITPDWLQKLIGIAAQPKVGCVGAKLLYPDNSIQHAGVVLGLGGYAAHSHRCLKEQHPGYFNRPHLIQTVSAVTGACLAIKKSTYLEMNGLDESFQVAYNDVDFCLRVQAAGYDNVYCAEAKLYHFESKTRGSDQQNAVKRARFEKEKEQLKTRWGKVIEQDPYYSPHLTRGRENFTLRLEY